MAMQLIVKILGFALDTTLYDGPNATSNRP